MKNFSEEVIEVNDKEYTLFLNRTGITLLEKTTKFSELLKLIGNRYVNEENIEVSDDFNPNELLKEYDSNFDEDEEKLRKTVIMFYCIALSKNHNLSLNETKEWFENAEKDYGIDQLTALMIQMIENANIPNQSDNLKNLKALKSTR